LPLIYQRLGRPIPSGARRSRSNRPRQQELDPELLAVGTAPDDPAFPREHEGELLRQDGRGVDLDPRAGLRDIADHALDARGLVVERETCLHADVVTKSAAALARGKTV